ncbi:hypothetical protein P7K49_021340 [Saguinus oedipus]|uniref:Uncharacterized protein n=1 Tax=Saguinus oedipus TaxID=9490 RepID=A0ABQ9USE8_SAGOE|nr:hypothetical protein P7K49_021340 [Saguinus oedipus]
MCSSICKCIGCKNYEESPERKTLMSTPNCVQTGGLEGSHHLSPTKFPGLPKSSKDRERAILTVPPEGLTGESSEHSAFSSCTWPCGEEMRHPAWHRTQSKAAWLVHHALPQLRVETVAAEWTLPDVSDRRPSSCITWEVVEATCACLLAQGEEAEKEHYSQCLAEQMILEEFGRCLSQILHIEFKSKGLKME